jgi:hypothetical protein
MSKVILSKEQVEKMVSNVISEQFDHENSIAKEEMEEQQETPPTERYTVAKGEDGTFYIINQYTGNIIAKK